MDYLSALSGQENRHSKEPKMERKCREKRTEKATNREYPRRTDKILGHSRYRKRMSDIIFLTKLTATLDNARSLSTLL